MGKFVYENLAGCFEDLQKQVSSLNERIEDLENKPECDMTKVIESLKSRLKDLETRQQPERYLNE